MTQVLKYETLEKLNFFSDSVVTTSKQQSVKYHLTERINLNEQFRSPYVIYERCKPQDDYKYIKIGQYKIGSGSPVFNVGSLLKRAHLESH